MNRTLATKMMAATAAVAVAFSMSACSHSDSGRTQQSAMSGYGLTKNLNFGDEFTYPDGTTMTLAVADSNESGNDGVVSLVLALNNESAKAIAADDITVDIESNGVPATNVKAEPDKKSAGTGETLSITYELDVNDPALLDARVDINDGNHQSVTYTKGENS